MPISRTPSSRGKACACVSAMLACAGLLGAGRAAAAIADLAGGVTADYKLNLTYGAAMRMDRPSQALVNGPVDAFQFFVAPPTAPGQNPQLLGFSHSGFPTTINFDDGDRNFKRYSLINNRATAFGELNLSKGHYGFHISGDAFYDQAYHRPNGNTSPATVNKIEGDWPNVDWPANPGFNRFSNGTRYFDGGRLRILDAYGYGTWFFGEQSSINLRVGRQLVAWGQSLFFSGLALAQSRADATKSFVPGADVKSILLPTNQVSVRLNVVPELTFVGYYKLEYASTELFPVGDYFSPSDAIGPGASFVYGAANPLVGTGNCTGLLSNIQAFGTTTDLGFLEPLVCGALGTLTGGSTGLLDQPFIRTERLGDIRPSNGGQYGVGVDYQLTNVTSVGFHYLRYANANPTVQLNVGFAPFARDLAGLPTSSLVSTALFNQLVPVSYNVKYFDGIHFYNLSYSTVIGAVNVGGEINYRDGVDTAVTAEISGVVSPVFTRSRMTQALVSALYVTNPDLWYDDLVFTGEAGVLHVNDVTAVAPSPGIKTDAFGGGKELFYSRNSWGMQMLIIPTRHNVFSGWDISTPLGFSMLRGNPALAGAFGALYGDGDKRLSIGLTMQYLQNLRIGASYNFFFGDVNRTIGKSLLKANPYTDRNYVTLSVSYDLF